MLGCILVETTFKHIISTYIHEILTITWDIVKFSVVFVSDII